MHLFSLHYLPQIKYLRELLKSDQISFEVMEHFQRQTYRNRCEIYTADGIHKLIVPINHGFGENGRRVMKDVKISYNDNWQMQHLRTIRSAYQSSSYYEYFEADFNKLYEKKYEFLVDLNLASIEMILKFLKKPLSFNLTSEYIQNPTDLIDHREEFSNNNYEMDFEYYQVFENKKGKISNLSCIDLLFNCGPAKTLECLMRIT